MSASEVGRLTFINFTLDHMEYLNVLNKNLKNRAEDLKLEDDFQFQQDNDSKHTAHNVKLWLLYNVKNLLHTPPQSFRRNEAPSNILDLLE